MPTHSTKSLKILVIRFSSIGDIILCTPVFRCLKEQIGAEVHFICKKGFHTLLEENPYLDHIHVFDKDQGLKQNIQELKKEYFDYIIDLHKNLRSLRIRLALGVKSYAFNKLNIEKWLLCNFKLNYLPQVHIVDRYMATLQFLGIQNDGKGLDYFIPHKDQIQLNDWKIPKQFIAFVIGAAHNTKKIPVEKIMSICQSIQNTIVLIGGPADSAEGEYIASKVNHVISLCGALNLHQSASVLAQAQKVIAHDTGFMHIAAALKKEVISIWGNTVPEFGMTPFYGDIPIPSYIIEVQQLNCRPCSKIGHNSCPKGHFKCMWQISEEQILDLVQKTKY